MKYTRWDVLASLLIGPTLVTLDDGREVEVIGVTSDYVLLHNWPAPVHLSKIDHLETLSLTEVGL